MSCLWFALVCLTVVTAANANLADSIQRQLAGNAVFKAPIPLDDVYVLLIKGQHDKTAKVSEGTVTYTTLGVTVESQTDKQIVFTVTGDAACKYNKYEALKKTMPAWTSSSGRGQNLFRVTLDVNNCVPSKTPSVASEKIDGIGTCESCKGKTPGEINAEMMGRFSYQVSYEVMVKINRAIKAAVSNLDLKGSGFQKC